MALDLVAWLRDRSREYTFDAAGVFQKTGDHPWPPRLASLPQTEGVTPCITNMVTQARSMRAVVEPWGCGRVYADKDPAALALAILELADPVVRAKLGDAGFEAVSSRYNWATDEQILLSALRSLCPSGTNGAVTPHCEQTGADGVSLASGKHERQTIH